MQATRDMYIQLLDANTMFKREAEGYDWIRIDKSTLGVITNSIQTENKDYIDAKNASTEITGNQVTQPQEIILNTSNPMFQAVDNFYHHYYTGADCIVKSAQARPVYTSDGTIDKTKWAAQVWDESTLMVTELDYKGGKYSMTINYNGDPKNGYITKDDDGAYVFTEDDSALDFINATPEPQTLKATKSTKLSDE